MSGTVAPASGRKAWRRLGRALRPKGTRAQITAGLLCLLLGFGVATQFRQTQEADFSTLRQNELIEVLGQLTNRADRLRQDNDLLERQLEELTDSRTQGEAARQAALDQAQIQGILAGTIGAVGPGVEVLVSDPDGLVDAALMASLVDELRNAGAEAISVNEIRVTVSTWFAAGELGLVAEGHQLNQPYSWLAIGDPTTLRGALGSAGGALTAMEAAGATTKVTDSDQIEITAVKNPPPADHALALE